MFPVGSISDFLPVLLLVQPLWHSQCREPQDSCLLPPGMVLLFPNRASCEGLRRACGSHKEQWPWSRAGDSHRGLHEGRGLQLSRGQSRLEE